MHSAVLLVVYPFSALERDPGAETAGVLLENDDPASVGDVVVNGVTTGVSAIGKHNAPVVDGVVVVVVVAAEYSHHVAALKHGIEEAAVELGVANRLSIKTHAWQFGPVFRERDVQEGQAWHRFSAIGSGVCFAGLVIPAHLVGMHRLVHLVFIKIGAGIEEPKKTCYFVRFMGENVHRVVGRRIVTPVREEIAGNRPHEVVEFGVCLVPVVVVVAEADGKRQSAAGNVGKHVEIGGIGRRSIDEVAGKDHQVGFLEIQKFLHPLEHNVAAGVLVNIMEVGELKNPELPVLIEAQHGPVVLYGSAGAGKRTKSNQKVSFHLAKLSKYLE